MFENLEQLIKVIRERKIHLLINLTQNKLLNDKNLKCFKSKGRDSRINRVC